MTPISRREFLPIAAGSTALVLRPQCLRAEGDRKKLSFIVVTDTHLGYRDKDSALRQWDLTAEELATAEGDIVLHLGDLVDQGREEKYPQYIKIRDAIGKPVYEIPGNHDPDELFQKYIRPKIDHVVDCQWLRFVLLGNSHTDSHDGFLTEDQLGWLDKQCSQAAELGLFVVVCMHVPAHKNRHPDRGWYVKPLHGQTRLYEILAKHERRVLATFHGHFHNGIRGWNDHGPVHEICFPSVLYNLNRRLEEQKAPGYNVNEFRPGYTLVEIDGSEMKLRYKPVNVDEKAQRTCELRQFSQEE